MNTMAIGILSALFAGPASFEPERADAAPQDLAAVASRADRVPAAEHLQRAREAAEVGEVDAALQHVRQGLRSAGDDRRATYDRARLEAWAIDWRERVVMGSLERGELEAARRDMLRLSEPLTSDLARSRLDGLRQRVADAERRSAQRGDRSAEARIARRLAASERALVSAEKELNRARAAGAQTVRAARRAEAALRRYRGVEDDVDRWLRDSRFGQRDRQRLMAVRIRAGSGAVDAMLAIANARTTQGDFREALEWVERVALRAPRNAEAKELRRTIQLASAASGGWIGWGPAGRFVGPLR